jgi:hypothetical protein
VRRQHHLFRDIRLDRRVSDAVDAAIPKWAGAERAWEAIEFTLSHDQLAGVSLNEAGTLRAFVFHGAQSASIPDISVTYTSDGELTTIHDAQFIPSRFPFHGSS